MPSAGDSNARLGDEVQSNFGGKVAVQIVRFRSQGLERLMSGNGVESGLSALEIQNRKAVILSV